MGYARHRLNEGEDVLVDVRPHWWFLSGPAAVTVLVIVGSMTAAVAGTPHWTVWAFLVALAASVIWLAARYARWATTRLVVTTSRVIDQRGVLARRGREIPLSALSDIGYRQTFLGRVIGMGDVLLESAGKAGQEVFADLPHPAEIHNEIYRQLQFWRRPAPVGGTTTAGTSIIDQIDQLDQLRRRGVLTDAEFEAKKSQLLGRI